MTERTPTTDPRPPARHGLGVALGTVVVLLMATLGVAAIGGLAIADQPGAALDLPAVTVDPGSVSPGTPGPSASTEPAKEPLGAGAAGTAGDTGSSSATTTGTDSGTETGTSTGNGTNTNTNTNTTGDDSPEDSHSTSATELVPAPAPVIVDDHGGDRSVLQRDGGTGDTRRGSSGGH